jgi:DNA invertase Pin-like site-specific DNA recombinase
MSSTGEIIYLDQRRTSPLAVIYTRLSAVKGRDKHDDAEDVNVAEQEAKLRALADVLGCQVAGVFTDNDLTAYKASKRYRRRPGFEELLARITKGDVGVILVYQPFRLYRSHSDLERLMPLCQQHAISVKTIQGGDLDLTSATGQMIAEFMASVGKQEVALLIERAKQGKDRVRASGRWPGGRVPYGYRVTGDVQRGTYQVTVAEDEAQHIRWMCEQVLAGTGFMKIARTLTEDGVPSPGKKLPKRRRVSRPHGWEATQVRMMVTNPRYAGLVSLRGRPVRDEAGHDVIGSWPKIIDRETWYAIRAKVSRPGEGGRPGPRPKWLLSGIARCGKCGSQNVRVLKTANDRRGYCCRDCYGVSRDAERLDAIVETVTLARLRAPGFAAALAPAGPDVDALQLRRDRINGELADIASPALTLTLQQRSGLSAPLIAELAETDAEIEAALTGSDLAQLARVTDPAAAWEDEWTVSQKRAIVRALWDVTILPVKLAHKMGPAKGWQIGQAWFPDESVTITDRLSGQAWTGPAKDQEGTCPSSTE